jgi:hypothetical protein
MKFCTKCSTEKSLDLFYSKQSSNWCKACHKNYRDSRKEKVSELSKNWNCKNKERASLTRKIWKQKNKSLNRAYSLNRLAKKKQRVPSWFGELDELVMKEAHDLAFRRGKITGVKWAVDHIIPMNGKLVSGLHIHNNIQVITASENCKKHNKYEVQ